MIGRLAVEAFLKSVVLAFIIASLVVAPVFAQVQEAAQTQQGQQGQSAAPPPAADQNQAQAQAPPAGQSAAQQTATADYSLHEISRLQKAWTIQGPALVPSVLETLHPDLHAGTPTDEYPQHRSAHPEWKADAQPRRRDFDCARK